MANESIQGLPYPDSTAMPDGPTQIKALADAVAPRLPMRFASKAERDATVAAPVDGMLAITTDYGILWRYSAAVAKWVVVNVPTFASTAIRDAQISAPVVGTRCFVGARDATPSDTLWEYLYDGAAWVVLTSPWQAITVNTPTYAGSNSPSVRMMGGQVTFKGAIGGPMASTTTTYTVGTVPVGFRPPSLDGRSVKSGSDVSSGAGFPFMCVGADGSILIRTAVAGTVQVSLGGLSGYSVLV